MMRSEDDYTADDVLKRQWLDAMLDDDRRRLVATFDDRDHVVVRCGHYMLSDCHR